MIFRKMLIAAAVLVGMAVPSTAQAQDWPTRPVTMVVPFAAGGPVDVLGRILAQYLTEVLGKQVIIDNIPGAGGMNGSLRVSQGAPDGYQFVLGSIGTHALNQTLSKKPLYNAATDFAPVALVADVGLVLLTRKDLPAKNLQEFIAYAKANQGKMQFASGGAGTSSHIGCVLLNQTIGIDVVHVPYRGGGPAQADLVAGRIDYLCNIASTVGQALESKQVNALAALTRERSPILPHLPTAHEQGLTDFDAYTWNAVFYPKSTPPAQVDKLNAAIVKVMEMPAFRERLAKLGLIVPVPERRTPAYLGKFVSSEIEKWAVPIKASGAQN
ncbi:MAG: Bug family tripartite tricarboxylate transporter substrate binding protein [Xanthobacteraceae bacterium]